MSKIGFGTKKEYKMVENRLKSKKLRTCLFVFLPFAVLVLFLSSYSLARTPTWNGWDFDIIKFEQESETLVVFVKNSSRVSENVGTVRVNCIIDGREVASQYLDIAKGRISAARFHLPDITGVHFVVFQVWGGWYFTWKFDESPPKQINFGATITLPSSPFEITTRESGPYTIYSCKFSANEVNRMADDWNIADYYARRIAWRIVTDKFNMDKEILIALAITIKTTADNLHYQARQNRNCVLVYELNFDNRMIPVIGTLQAVQSALETVQIMFEAGKFIWYPATRNLPKAVGW